MSDYFNATGTIGFTCDNCGRELLGCTWVNGMKFCAKCYQETFGTNTKEITYVYGGNLKEHIKVIEEKDKKIVDLEAKLAEYEAIKNKYKTIFLDRFVDAKVEDARIWKEEYDKLKQQLAEKEKAYQELLNSIKIEDLSNINFIQVNDDVVRFSEGGVIYEYNKKDNTIYKIIDKSHQDKISFAVEALEIAQKYIQQYVNNFDDMNDCLCAIDNQIKQLKEMK